MFPSSRLLTVFHSIDEKQNGSSLLSDPRKSCNIPPARDAKYLSIQGYNLNLVPKWIWIWNPQPTKRLQNGTASLPQWRHTDARNRNRYRWRWRKAAKLACAGLWYLGALEFPCWWVRVKERSKWIVFSEEHWMVDSQQPRFWYWLNWLWTINQPDSSCLPT